MNKIKVVKIEEDDANGRIKGSRVTLENELGETFTVNIPHESWGDGQIYGLNLVFDHSGDGDHYV